MIFVTTYKIKPFLSNEETKKLLEVFAQAGPGPGTTAHYVAADGSHGVVISENDDVVAAYRNIQNYTQWVARRRPSSAGGSGAQPAAPGGVARTCAPAE